jgi:hypothetical protein
MSRYEGNYCRECVLKFVRHDYKTGKRDTFMSERQDGQSPFTIGQFTICYGRYANAAPQSSPSKLDKPASN